MCDDERDSADEFSFSEWAEGHGLTRATTAILIKEGCNTKEILQVLSSTAVSKLCLSIGQGIAVRKGLRALGNRAGSIQVDAASNSPIDARPKRGREEETVGLDSQIPSAQRWHGGIETQTEKELDEYLREASKKDPAEPRSSGDKYLGECYGSDPRMNLVIKSQKRKALKVANFVPETVTRRMAAKGRDRMALVQDSEGKLSIKEEDDLPGHLTLSEWGAANLRLMQHLMDTRELARSDIEFYNAYTLMVFEFVENYEWPSILAFDTRYRELQAHTNFPWGTPCRGLEVSSLVPRARKEKQKDKSRSKGTYRGDRKGACRTFAREGSCPYGDRCIFTHKQDKSEQPKNAWGHDQNRER